MDSKIVFFIVIFVNFVTAEPSWGEPCSDKETGLNGTCKYAADCAKLPTEILKLPRCVFKKNKGVFCCPDQPVVREQKVTKIDSRIVGATAKAKCKEYSKLVNTIKPSVVPLIDAGDMTTNECREDVKELVVGGTNASAMEFPHMVLLGYDVGYGETNWTCGGALISEEFVLTAAHCLNPIALNEVKFAKMGFIDKQHDNHAQMFNIVDRIPYPKYIPGYKDYDIALIKLDKNASLSILVRPACLYTERDILESTATAIGWGIDNTGMQSEILQKVDLEFYDPDRCQSHYKRTTTIRAVEDNLHVCAGSMKEVKDTSQGDSGGPLQIHHKENDSVVNCVYDIVGVTSFGFRSPEKHVPAVYTRVSHYVKWIEDTVWPSS